MLKATFTGESSKAQDNDERVALLSGSMGGRINIFTRERPSRSFLSLFCTMSCLQCCYCFLSWTHDSSKAFHNRSSCTDDVHDDGVRDIAAAKQRIRNKIIKRRIFHSVLTIDWHSAVKSQRHSNPKTCKRLCSMTIFFSPGTPTPFTLNGSIVVVENRLSTFEQRIGC